MPSKLGVHVVLGSRRGYGDFVRNVLASGATLAVVKCVDDFGAAFEAKQFNPRTLTIGRLNVSKNGVDMQAFEPRNYPTPELAAMHYISLALPIWVKNPHIDVWETFNEYSGNWAWQADFYVALLDLVRTNGNNYNLGLWSCSAGNPPDDALPQIARACAYAKNTGKNHILCLHEYAGLLEGESGLFKDAFNNGVVLRYRRTWEYLKANDADLPIAITECGENAGGGFTGTRTFVADAALLDAELQRDEYLRGAALWTLGNWEGANFEMALPELAAYIGSQARVPPPPLPPPPPEPVTELDARVLALEQLMSTLRCDVSSGKASIASLQQRLTIAEMKIAQLPAMIRDVAEEDDRHYTELGQVAASIASDFDKLRKRFDALIQAMESI